MHISHGKLAGAMLVGMLIARTCAFAQDVSQYAHTAWKIRDGFAKGSILSIAQTPDGYLWLGTAFGLYRFDGVRNVLWQPTPNQQLPSTTISTLVAARDGTLWIGTWSGLASWKDGKLTHYAQLAGLHILALVEDKDGSIWAGTSGPDGRLCEIHNGDIRCHPEIGDVSHGVFGLHKDGKGNLWVELETGVWRWRPGPPQFYAVRGLLNGRRQRMADGEDGALLIATTDAVMRLADGKAEVVYRFPTARRGFRRLEMLRDRDGGLWVCPAGQGIVHIHEGRTDLFSESDGLSGNDIYELFEDHEGNIWVATVNGLDRFHKLPVVTYFRKQGLSDIPWGGMLAAKDGSVWFATLNGLNRLSRGQVTVYSQQRTKAGGREIVGSGLPDEGVGSLFQDSHERIWVSTLRGIGYLTNDRFIPVAVPGGLVESLTEDTSGNLWIANRDVGLLRLSQHNELQQIPWATFGRKDYAVTLAPDPLHDGVWLGFSRGGIAWFRDGHVQSSYSAADGLGAGRVNQLRFDGQGTLWIASEGGLGRLKNGRIVTLTSKTDLPCDAVQWTMDDDAQSVWIMMPCGLVRIARSELDTWPTALNRTHRIIRTTVFDSSDGLRLLAVVGDYTPRVSKASDGKLWFSVPDGISVVDPSHLPINKLLPPVHVEQVITDRKEYWGNLSGEEPSNLRLPPLVRELEIDYTALSLVAPEKVLFRYKLEGWDQDWQDAGPRRQAFYSNLPPRKYTFRVKASNNSGLWNEAGASLHFSIAPAFYQTIWFRGLCVLAFFALLWGVYQMRVHHLQEQEKTFREAVETMPALAFVADPKGNRTFMNKGWIEYTGLTSEEPSASGWEKTIHPEDLKRVTERWRESQATGQSLEYEARLRRASDGTYRWFLIRAVPVRDKHGKIVKWCGAATDIEDRKQAEQLQTDLTHASRVSTMGELVASISHELAQPLTVTTANAQASLRWLQRDPPNLTEVRKGTERIAEAGALASEIINRLRSLYKKAHPRRELVAMNEVVGEMAGMMGGKAREYGVSIRTHLKGGLPMTMADRVQVQQVLMNLMLNGIEAMKETGGVLTVRSQLDVGGEIEISINDTGPGLPPDKAGQMFEAFFTTKPQGSGMGLAISKSIVESQGGRIWADGNGGPGGGGATFHFTLPVAPEDTNPPANAA